MSTGVVQASPPGVADQTDERLDLHRRFIMAGLADPAVFGVIPRDALFFLLPEDDPAFVEGEIAVGLAALRRGQDVYFRHVSVAEWPTLPDESGPTGPMVGERRVSYGPDGTITANLVYGADGAWHETDAPPPGPRDDEPD